MAMGGLVLMVEERRDSASSRWLAVEVAVRWFQLKKVHIG